MNNGGTARQERKEVDVPGKYAHWVDDGLEPVDRFSTPASRNDRRKQRHSPTGRHVNQRSERDKTVRTANTVRITLRNISRTDLEEAALEHFSSVLFPERGRSGLGRSDPHWVAKISVNFARHCLTSYDATLRDGQNSSYSALFSIVVKNRTLDIIAAAHPYFATECSNQKASVPA